VTIPATRADGRLQDKVALVTGGSRSIGAAVAIAFAGEGAQVALSYRTGEREAGDIVDRIEQAGGKALAIYADVSKRADVDSMVHQTIDTFGHLDVLVNNAAVLKRTPFLDISEEEWDWLLAVNLKGYFLCAQAAARHMVERGSGIIINMSSASEVLAGRDLTHYCVAKGGVRLLTRQLALELAPHGIRANAIAPGLLETDLNRSDLADPEFRAYRLGMIPLGVIGVPEDVVGAAVFLASEESRMSTGATLFLDGGQTIA
jgi:glucose 1-dehydrogenase